MFIIVFTMINIVATMIYIIFANIDNVFEASKVRLGATAISSPKYVLYASYGSVDEEKNLVLMFFCQGKNESKVGDVAD